MARREWLANAQNLEGDGAPSKCLPFLCPLRPMIKRRQPERLIKPRSLSLKPILA